MKWHFNEPEVIDRIFIRVMSKESLIVWSKPKVNQLKYNFIWIYDGKIQELSKPEQVEGGESLGGGLPNQIKVAFQTDKAEGEFPGFNPEVRDPESVQKIAEFFDQCRHVLPDTLRARIFPPVIPPDPIGDIHPRNRTYVIGGLLLVLAVGYIAHRIIVKYRAPQTPPGEHLEKALQTQNLVSAT